MDDDARVRHALRALLDVSDDLCPCGEAVTGPEALAVDEELDADVVLLDLLLPSAEEGLEALAALVARGRAVVALSICAALATTALEAGAVAFVEKGITPDHLVDTLRRARR